MYICINKLITITIPNFHVALGPLKFRVYSIMGIIEQCLHVYLIQIEGSEAPFFLSLDRLPLLNLK